METELYDLTALPVSVSGLFAELDGTCPSDTNLNKLAGIEGFLSESVQLADHMDLISNNDAGFVGSLLAQLSELATPIEQVEMCPEPIAEPASCLEMTDIKLGVIARRIETVERQMESYRINSEGDPELIEAKLENTMCHLEKFCIHHRRREEWLGYTEVIEGAEQSRRKRGIEGGRSTGGMCQGKGQGKSQ